MMRLHKFRVTRIPVALLLTVWMVGAGGGAKVFAACVTQPLMQGQDPTVAYKDGWFHLVQSDGCNLRLRRSPTLAGLSLVPNQVIYSPGCSEIWAPEIHWLNNRWYLYYTMNTNLATGGVDRRGFVAESIGPNPYGPYTDKGIVFSDFWNIDGNVFTWNNQLYYVFSGDPTHGGTNQRLYVAPMSDPHTLSGPPVLISAPTESWEITGLVNEGPWGFQHEGTLFIVYSASGCWTDDYTLGLLTLSGSDPLSASSWTKTGPVFTKKSGAYGPGHNCVLQDGSGEWWNFYHANNNSGEGCGGLRQIRAQRLFWDAAGMPDFGSPVPVGSQVVDGADFLVAQYLLNESIGAYANSLVCGQGTVVGPATWVNPGLLFNGVDTSVDCGSTIGNDVQHALTLSAWIRPEAFSDWAGIVTKGTTAAPYAMQVWGDGALRFTANWGLPPGAVNEGSWNSDAKLSLGTWQHVAVTYDGARVRFYINATQDSNEPLVELRCGVIDESLVIGADFPGGDEFFAGAIRDVRVYGRALDAAQIQALVNVPPVLDPVEDVAMVAGQTLLVTNTATDADVPAQTLTFSLLEGPSGAVVESGSGVLTWPSTQADAGTTNPVTIRVMDDGIPSLSDTQRFEITARLPVRPELLSPATDGGVLSFDVTGDPGLDYGVVGSSNLLDWTLEFVTNAAATPFQLSWPVPLTEPQHYYRLEIQ